MIAVRFISWIVVSSGLTTSSLPQAANRTKISAPDPIDRAYVSDSYLDVLQSGVNLGLQFTEASIFLRSGEPIVQGVVCPDVVAAAALFAASAGRSLRWRLGGTVLAVALIWLLQSPLIVLELQLAIYHYAGGEIVALVREWSGAAVVLLLWFATCGSLLRCGAEPQRNAASAPKSDDVVRAGRGPLGKMSKAQKKHRLRIRQKSAGGAAQPVPA